MCCCCQSYGARTATRVIHDVYKAKHTVQGHLGVELLQGLLGRIQRLSSRRDGMGSSYAFVSGVDMRQRSVVILVIITIAASTVCDSNACIRATVQV